MAMPAHPPDLAGWVADNQCKVRNVLGYHCPGSDKRVASNCDSADDRRIRTDSASPFQARCLVKRVSIHLRITAPVYTETLF